MKRVSTSALLAIAALATAACGSSSQPSESATSIPTAAAATPLPPAATPLPPGASVQEILDSLSTLAADSREQFLIGQAESSGPIIIYTTTTDDLVALQNTAVAEAYPSLDIQYVRLQLSALIERFLAESDADQPIASIIQCDASCVPTFMDRDLLAKYSSPERANLDDLFKDLDGLYTAFSSVAFTFNYNTDLVSPDELPESLERLAADASWKGRLGRSDVGSGTRWVAAVLDYYGEDKGMEVLEGLAAQQPRLFGTNGNVREAVVSGQIHAGYDNTFDQAQEAKANGAPIDTYMLEPVFVSNFLMMLPNNAPNPYGAALVYDWQLAADGAQAQYAEVGRAPVNRNVDFVYADLFEGVELVEYSVEHLRSGVDKYSEIFLELFGG